jgi:hypothetical protein
VTAALRRCLGLGTGSGGAFHPHHKLFADELCLSLVTLVAKVRIADAQLRAQARKSAASAALNCACSAADVQAVVLLGTRVKSILSRLVR